MSWSDSPLDHVQITINMENKKKRRENYSYEEKLAFVDIINDHANIIENKITDAVGRKEKNRMWDLICLKFNKNLNKDVNVESLKNLWTNIKQNTRKHFAQLKQETYKTGGGRNKVKPDILYDKTYEIIQISVNGLYNPNDCDANCSKTITANLFEEIIDCEEENDDPNRSNTDSVFEFLTNEGEIDKWETWNPKVLNKPLSQPLNTLKGVTNPTRSSQPSNVKNDQNILIKSKIELTNLMKKELIEKSNIEKEILTKQLLKENLNIELLKYKLKNKADNSKVHIINNSDSD